MNHKELSKMKRYDKLYLDEEYVIKLDTDFDIDPTWKLPVVREEYIDLVAEEWEEEELKFKNDLDDLEELVKTEQEMIKKIKKILGYLIPALLAAIVISVLIILDGQHAL